ncbi:MAG TPA: GntR family transcriptional regulator [Intrasporangium sp.]|nr:GntR family transcriptional regulator [Intrasporangium sp.]
MALQRVARRSIPDEVFDQLLGELLGGDLGPGQPLPSERRLAEVLGVSRPAVREAIQRLATAGLVEVRQGDATTVLDFRRYGGLELLPRLLLAGGDLDLSVARSILEARLHVGPKIAELAATRGGPELASALDEVVAGLATDEDPVGRQRRALEFWSLLVDAADSITFRLMFNSMRAAYEPAMEMLAPVIDEKVDGYQALTAAVTAHEPEEAAGRAHELLAQATTSLLAAVDQLEEGR